MIKSFRANKFDALNPKEASNIDIVLSNDYKILNNFNTDTDI